MDGECGETITLDTHFDSLGKQENGEEQEINETTTTKRSYREMRKKAR